MGIHALKKRGMACFWGIKIWKKNNVFYTGKNVLGGERIGGRIRNNIYVYPTRNRYLYALWGSSPASVLKGFSLGIHALKKRGMACFRGIKIWKKINVFNTGKNV